MYLHELLLILLTGGLMIGIPIYIFFRKRMMYKPSEGGFHSLRVFKVTCINILLSIFAFFLFLFMLISVLSQQDTFSFAPETTILIIIFLVTLGLSVYGNGMYITAIVIKTFTPPDLRKQEYFKTQFIATHLFHGPISHTLIYSGNIIALFLLSVMDIFTGNGAHVSPLIMIFCGLITGAFFTIGQAFNGTIPYHFVTTLITFLLLSIVYFTKTHFVLFNSSLSTFFFSFSLSFLITSLVYLLWKTNKTKNIWDMSGY